MSDTPRDSYDTPSVILAKDPEESPGEQEEGAESPRLVRKRSGPKDLIQDMLDLSDKLTPEDSN